MNKLIYIVEDEENIRELLSCSLSNQSYDIKCFENAKSLLDFIDSSPPDLILLDVMMPGITGLEVLKIIKSNHIYKNIPIILITAKSTELDKVRGLDMGADDYITKPFSILEFLARVRAVFRRYDDNNQSNMKLICISDIKINSDTQEVYKGNKIIDLTLKEFKLLKLLMENHNRVVTRENILNLIWGYSFVGETRTVDMHVKTLRTKLSDNVDRPKYIKTIRGVGYKFIGEYS